MRQEGTYPPRVSSLPVSPHEVASRLARPTKASAARAEANSKTLGKSGTMTSVKKFGSRLSAIIPGRGYSGVPGSVDKSKSTDTAPVKANADNAKHGSSANDGGLLSASENIGTELPPSGFVGDVNVTLMVGNPTNQFQTLTTDSSPGRTIR
jgi:hypothetical protein